MGLGETRDFALYHFVLSRARWNSRAIARTPLILPPIVITLMAPFRSFFTAPVWEHVLVLVTGIVLTMILDRFVPTGPVVIGIDGWRPGSAR
jgi:hypothetical protein